MVTLFSCCVRVTQELCHVLFVRKWMLLHSLPPNSRCDSAIPNTRVAHNLFKVLKILNLSQWLYIFLDLLYIFKLSTFRFKFFPIAVTFGHPALSFINLGAIIFPGRGWFLLWVSRPRLAQIDVKVLALNVTAVEIWIILRVHALYEFNILKLLLRRIEIQICLALVSSP